MDVHRQIREKYKLYKSLQVKIKKKIKRGTSDTRGIRLQVYAWLERRRAARERREDSQTSVFLFHILWVIRIAGDKLLAG